MKIKDLKLVNYRCFDEIKIEFDSLYNLHVLIAPNMAGKSALLKAARIAISTYLRKINKGGKGISFHEHRVIGSNPISDIARNCTIEISTDLLKWSGKNWESANVKWGVYRNYLPGEKTKYYQINGGDIDKIAPTAYDRVIANKEQCIPLLLYVGTEYIHQPHAITDTLKSDGSAIQGYWYCLEENSMENYVFEWLMKMHILREEQHVKWNAAILYDDLPGIFLDSFENVIKDIFPGEIVAVQWIKDLSGKKYLLTFRFNNDEVRTYDMLSDGYRYLVLLSGELATRCLLLNKHLKYDAAKKTNGVVLIDEFGIHLHPELQNEALKRLSAVFPNIQFIISTHSPMLINGLKKEQIHILNKDKDGKRTVINPEDDIVGLGADGILLNIFGLESTYDTISRKWAEDYKELFNKKVDNQLTINEINQFNSLLEKLAGIKFDVSLLNSVPEDNLYIRFKERLLQLQKSNTIVDESITDSEIDTILKEILNKEK